MEDPTYNPERRPIAARHQPLSIRVASWLADRAVSPNAISVAGMICGILAGMAFAATSFSPLTWILFPAGAVLILLRLLANMFDGMVAIRTAKTSRLGELF